MLLLRWLSFFDSEVFAVVVVGVVVVCCCCVVAVVVVCCVVGVVVGVVIVGYAVVCVGVDMYSGVAGVGGCYVGGVSVGCDGGVASVSVDVAVVVWCCCWC